MKKSPHSNELNIMKFYDYIFEYIEEFGCERAKVCTKYVVVER